MIFQQIWTTHLYKISLKIISLNSVLSQLFLHQAKKIKQKTYSIYNF